jgi:hypothetical protein
MGGGLNRAADPIDYYEYFPEEENAYTYAYYPTVAPTPQRRRRPVCLPLCGSFSPYCCSPFGNYNPYRGLWGNYFG